MRISTWGSVKARKPRSCNSRLPAGKGYMTPEYRLAQIVETIPMEVFTPN
jgi:hypothetical protein